MSHAMGEKTGPLLDSGMSHQVPPAYSDVPPTYGFQAPPPQQFPQQPQQFPQQSPQVVYVQQPTRTVVITPMAGLGPNAVQTKCPSCQQNITTRVDKQTATKAHIAALLLCLFGCWPCVCIPYCMDSCKNANHFCSSCNAFIGTYAVA